LQLLTTQSLPLRPIALGLCTYACCAIAKLWMKAYLQIPEIPLCPITAATTSATVTHGCRPLNAALSRNKVVIATVLRVMVGCARCRRGRLVFSSLPLFRRKKSPLPSNIAEMKLAHDFLRNRFGSRSAFPHPYPMRAVPGVDKSNYAVFAKGFVPA